MSRTAALAYEILDVFAEAPLEGNPLAVFFGAERLDSATMQALARETNLSETTFVLGDAARDGAFDVRIFTPASELPYAGHPTLGTAFAIRRRLLAGDEKEVALRLGVGRVPVRFEADGVTWLTAPAARFEPLDSPACAAAALGLPREVLHTELPVESQVAGVRQLFVPLADAHALSHCRIDPSAYRDLIARGAPASIYAFARGARDPRNHFSVRLFAPALGVPEDPATGSAAGWLGAYLVRHRALGDGPIDVRLEQGHALSRPSLLRVRASTAGSEVGGRVLPVARGEWLLAKETPVSDELCRLKVGLAEMLKGGVILDVTSAEQARITEDAGASAVMALERVPADIRREGGVALESIPESERLAERGWRPRSTPTWTRAGPCSAPARGRSCSRSARWTSTCCATRTARSSTRSCVRPRSTTRAPSSRAWSAC